MAESIQGTNTKLIVVSDHGMIDMSEKSEIWIEDFEGLSECLTLPILWGPRVKDCFIHPNEVKDFKKIVETQMSKYC